MKNILIIITLFHLLSCNNSEPINSLDIELVKEISFEKSIGALVYLPIQNKLLFGEKKKSIFDFNDAGNEKYKLSSLDLNTYEINIIEESGIQFSYICVSNDNRYYATSDYKGNIKIREVENDNLVYDFKGNGKWINEIYFYKDNYLIFSNLGEKEVYLLNYQTNTYKTINLNKQVNTFKIFGDHIIFGNHPNLEVWDKKEFKYLKDLEYPIVGNSGKSDKYLGLGLYNGSIVVINKNLEKVQTLKRHFKSVLDLSIQNDLLISGSRDQSFLIWDIKSGNILLEKINIHKGRIDFTKFLSDRIATYGEDRVLRIWKMKNFKKYLNSKSLTQIENQKTNQNKNWENNITYLRDKYDIKYDLDTMYYEYSIDYEPIIKDSFQFIKEFRIIDIYKKDNEYFILISTGKIVNLQLKLSESLFDSLNQLWIKTNRYDYTTVLVVSISEIYKYQTMLNAYSEDDSFVLEFDIPSGFFGKGELIDFASRIN